MRRLRLFGVIAALAVTATLFTVQPAQAAVTRCNSNTTTGVIIYQITPPGSFTRYISAKVCLVYDSNSVRNSTAVYCRTSGGAGCDIRAEVLHAKLDHYNTAGGFLGTVVDQWFPASTSGYSSGWSWLGYDYAPAPGWLCTYWWQANDFDIRVRFGFDGVLRNVGNAFSGKGDVC